MNDFARLEEKLSKLRQRERAPGEGRKLKGADASTRLAALVDEIDETILPRRLTLTLDGAVLHLAVANRRLQAMLAPAPAIEGAADLAGVALPDVEDAHVPALRTVLDQILALPGPVAMTARRLDVAFASDIGIPANLLGRAWGVEDVGQTEALAPSELMRKFLDDLGDDALAWLRIEGEEVADQRGDPERIASLGEQAAIFLDGYFSKFEALFPAEAKACGTLVSAGAGEAMLFVEIGEISAFVVAEPSRIVSIAQGWQALVVD